MDSIPHLQDHAQQFPAYVRDQVTRRAANTPYYHAASLHATRLTNSQFLLYSQVAILANFGDRIADLQQRAVVLRSWRTKRQINRTLNQLVQRSYLVQHGPKQYSLRGRVQRADNARLRPLRPGLLHSATDSTTALYARFMLALAASRLPWCRWTWRTVRKALACDTRAAQQLYAGLQALRGAYNRSQLRRVVFWSDRPQWQLYVTKGGQVKADPRPGSRHMLQLATAAIAAARGSGGSDYVPPRGGPLMALVGAQLKALTCTPGLRPSGADWGGRGQACPGGTPPWTTAALAQCDQVTLRLARHQAAKREYDQLSAIARGARQGRRRVKPAPWRAHMEGNQDRAAGDEPTPGQATGLPAEDQQNQLPPGGVFEALIAGMPPAARQRMNRDPAVARIRAQRRLQRGYRA